jgi:hypothetical protein
MSGRPALVPLLALVVMLAAPPSFASWIPNGIPAAPSDSAQSNPVILSDGARGAYLAFEGSDRWRVWAQRLGADGAAAPGWSASGVALPKRTRPNSWVWSEVHPTMALGASGPYVANDAFSDAGRVTLNRLAPEGGLVWPTGTLVTASPDADPGVATESAVAPRIASPPVGDYFETIAPDGAGGALVAWNYLSRSYEEIAIQRVDPDGGLRWGATGIGLSMSGWSPVVCSDGAGGAYVAWVTFTNGWDIVVQHVLANGAIDPIWPVDGLPVCSIAGRQSHPCLIADGSGGCLVFWQDARDAIQRIFGSHLHADATRAPGWPVDGASVCGMPAAPGIVRDSYYTDPLEYFSAIEDGAGGAFICWTDRRNGDADVYALRVRGAGGPAAGWLENGTPVCRAAADQDRPTLAADGVGGIYVTWQDARSGELDVYVQRLTPGGARAAGWSEDGFAICAAPGNQRAPVIAASADGSAIVAWTDERGPVSQIYVQRFSPDALVSVLASLVSAEFVNGLVRLEWWIPSESGDLTIFRSRGEGAYAPIARARADGEGRIVFEDRDLTAGASYHYRVGDSADPDQATGDAWVTVPELHAFSFAGVVPQPARANRMSLDLTAPRAGSLRVEAFDVAGRRALALARTVDAGRQLVPIEWAGLRPGIWLLRLTWGSTSITRRVCVTD